MTKIVLVGAGSLQFGTGMLGDIFQSAHLKGADIILHDINLKAAKRTLGVAADYISANNLDHKVSATTDLGDALAGADFVVISIEVGDRFALWDLDWKVPQQYGIPQVYGENGGPGGLFHSLRIVPPILDICQSVADTCPDATVFCYSNPMSRICTTVHRKFPDLKFVGMCHEIVSLERHLAPLLGVERSEITYRAGGLNHFSVMTDVTYTKDGSSAYADVVNKAEAYFGAKPGYSEILQASRKTGTSIETEGWMEVDLSKVETIRPWSDRWLFAHVLKTFGALPITYDSHFGEYIQWAHDCSDHQGILDFYTYYRNFLGKTDPKIENTLKERVVPIIEALIGATPAYEEYAVNIPNKGFIKNLPEWICVEVPAIIDETGIQGISVDVPAGVRGLLSNQIGVHDMTAEAILNQSRELVVQALLVDPVVIKSQGMEALVDHMIAEQSPWLDYLS
ncbi:alpha-galactosidase [Shimia isoporae]|uniref:Alpha-galactosidase n=1 Tax=Shimia isoporae TaxID=647720 RepID=A0A4R1N3A6_9RHOB|nr:alpha-glucosidase [Shimia isoporae]TCL01187.1 alpha-galactosidase [Shimia isoporae]